MISNLTTGPIVTPPRIVIYGSPKELLSLATSKLSKSIFLTFEEGLKGLDCTQFIVNNWSENKECVILKFLEDLAKEDFDFLIIDSLTGLESLIFKHVCFLEEKLSMDAIPYGKGYGLAVDLFKIFLNMLSNLQKKKNITIFINGEADLETISTPAQGTYSFYRPKMFGKTGQKIFSWDVLMGWSDAVLFVGDKSIVYGPSADENESIVFSNEKMAFKAKDTLDINYCGQPFNENTVLELVENLEIKRISKEITKGVEEQIEKVVMLEQEIYELKELK